ncbi:MAG: adenylyl-sulfate kinase [Candidatus Theseobacter exili]|nr:adenylyl-sulfate kinase [Candidatus Theseobacter exili]
MSKYSYSPHGDCGLINRFIPEIERDAFRERASKLKNYTISNADLAAFYRIADGGLSPLDGPMNKDEFYQVLNDEIIIRNNKKFAWTIPIAFPAKKEEAEVYKADETVAVRNEHGVLVGLLEITDIYEFDKVKYNTAVYGTEREDHPGPKIVNSDSREYLLGGKIWALPQLKHSRYENYMLTPEQTRLIFTERKWEKIVAFQTRNPLHRAHEYAIVYGMEKLTREGYFTGAVLNPLVGETKSDDVPAEVRMATYEALLDNKILGLGDRDEALWKSKGYSLSDELILIGLDIKMFYAGPKEAVMHAIYRQNYGFTDIIIGRKHADAPFDDGMPAWGDFDAQDIFNNLKGDLLIKPVNVGFAAYYEELGRVGLIKEYKDRGYHTVSIAGKELRKKLNNGDPVDERVMRKSVSDILIKFYRRKAAEIRNVIWHDSGICKSDREIRNKHKGSVIWFTGLSGSGKSTIAVELQAQLFERGCNVYILDGDNIRHGLNSDLGFSPEDRVENIRRIGEVAKLFAEAGFLVLTAFISPYIKDREKVRALLNKSEFLEVFVDTPLDLCEKRDPKGMYKKARSGEIKQFTGISAPYEKPGNPEIAVHTDAESKEESAQFIIEYLEGREYINKIL